MPGATAFASVKHLQPGQLGDARKLLRYLQHREGSVRRAEYLRGLESGEYQSWADLPRELRDDRQPTPGHRGLTWVDRGLGEDYRTIAGQLDAWQGRGVLLRHWVLSPDPELVGHLPPERRFEVVARMAEQTVGQWYAQNGWGTPQYSYVVHDKTARHGLPMPHAHVVTPGTYDLEPWGRPDHVVRKAHIHDLHRTAQRCFERELERELGPERARQVIAERDARHDRLRQSIRQAEAQADGKPTQRDKRPRRALSQFHAVTQLLQSEQQRRQARREGRPYHQKLTTAHIRAYAERVTDGKTRQRHKSRMDASLAREIERAEALADARAAEAERQGRLLGEGRRIPTHAERQERAARAQRRYERRQHRVRTRELATELRDSEFLRGFLELLRFERERDHDDRDR
jgi:peptidoglycan/xylan/chitin deacetylase (PgdA/CDA1 family)